MSAVGLEYTGSPSDCYSLQESEDVVDRKLRRRGALVYDSDIFLPANNKMACWKPTGFATLREIAARGDLSVAVMDTWPSITS